MSAVAAAMILAAGRGERMQPLSASRAKPALPVLGRSLLARVVAHLASAGVRDFSINTHHRPESIESEARSVPNLRSLELFHEDVLMGTAGALVAPAARLREHATFVLHNSDTLVAAPLDALAAALDGDPRAVGAVLVRPGAALGYRPLRLLDGLVTGVGEGPGEPATFLGVSVLRTSLLDGLREGAPSSLFEDLLFPALARGATLHAVPYEGSWLEFTSPASYRATLAALVGSHRGDPAIDLPGGAVALRSFATGSAFAGPGASISNAASLHGACVVEQNAVVHAGARLANSVVLEGARIAPGAHLERVVVAEGVAVPANTTFREGTLVAGADGLRLVSFHAREVTR